MNGTTLFGAQPAQPVQPAQPAQRRGEPPRTIGGHLTEGMVQPEHAAAIRRLARRALLPVAVAAALVGLWVAWAPLSGAVVAGGRVQAELGRKVVQHQEGGLLREVLVRPGQTVRRGDPLLVIGDVRNDATIDLLRRQRDGEQLRALRAAAEAAMAPAVRWPATAGAGDDTLQRERGLFEARRQVLEEQVAALQSQIAPMQSRLAALAEQEASARRSAELARAELEVNRPLAEDGFVQRTRLMTAERAAAEADARVAAVRSDQAETRSQLAQLESAIQRARSAYRERAAEELKEAGARIREAEDRLRPGTDQATRQTVRAPVDGIVMALRVTAPGTAVGPREPLLEIAPSDERLVVEAVIEPRDIEHVREGGAAEVRLTTSHGRRTPLVPARVLSVTPDAVAAGPNQPQRYLAQIEVTDTGPLAEHSLRLLAGMSAEVFIATTPRSMLQYFAEPLGVFARRAMRER